MRSNELSEGNNKLLIRVSGFGRRHHYWGRGVLTVEVWR